MADPYFLGIKKNASSVCHSSVEQSKKLSTPCLGDALGGVRYRRRRNCSLYFGSNSELKKDIEEIADKV